MNARRKSLYLLSSAFTEMTCLHTASRKRIEQERCGKRGEIEERRGKGREKRMRGVIEEERKNREIEKFGLLHGVCVFITQENQTERKTTFLQLEMEN